MSTKAEWEVYLKEELARTRPVLADLELTLDEKQPHLGGERFLMQAITSAAGPKLTMLGTTRTGERVVIKASSHPMGAQEIKEERRSRATLGEMNFAYRRFYAPKEVMFVERNGLTISVQEFIEQECAFLERPIEEQFALALEGFKMQEGAHATTYGHLQRMSRVFPIWDSGQYLATARMLSSAQGLDRALSLLESGADTIEQYCGFLTHSDFVPHNIRVKDGTMYLLDHSSLRFGNKYEGWARFVNFMTLYNPKLADALEQYVADNRTAEEVESLRLMRIYRLMELVAFYTGALKRTEGALNELSKARISFWRDVLASVLDSKPLESKVRETYIATRDALRSDDEKARQVGLH